MKNPFIIHRHLFELITRNLFLLFVLLLATNNLLQVNLSDFIPYNLMIFLMMFFGFSYVFFYMKKDEEKFKKEYEKWFKYSFLAVLVLVTIGSLNFEFINNISVLNTIINFIAGLNYILVLLGIGTGFITFYMNRERIETDLEKEKQEEEKQEQKRAKEFSSKYPRLAKIWGIRTIAKWMYKEGWGYSSILLLIIVVTTILKLVNIGNIPFQNDEIYHATTVSLNPFFPFLSEIQNYVTAYPRGMLVHYFALIGNLFLSPEFGLRIFGIISSIILIFISYIFSKPFGKKLAVLVSLIFSLDPLIFEFSRYSRFYIYSMLFMVYISYYLFKHKHYNNYLKIPYWVFVGALTPYLFNEFLLFFYAVILFSQVILDLYPYFKLQNLILIFKYKSLYLFLGSLIYLISNYIINSKYYPSLNSIPSSFFNTQIEYYFSNYSIYFIVFSISILTLFIKNKNNYRNYLSMISLGIIATIIFINYFSYTDTIRVILFLIIWQFLLIPTVLAGFDSKIKKYTTCLLVIYLALTISIHPYTIGDSYSAKSPVYERLPIILDHRAEIQEEDDYILASVCYNPLFTKYYFQKTADIFIRYEGSGMYEDENGNLRERTNNVLVLNTVEKIRDFVEKTESPILFDICGTSYPIYNEFYSSYLNRDYFTEVPDYLIREIERIGTRTIIKEDDFSRIIVYCSESVSKVFSICER